MQKRVRCVCWMLLSCWCYGLELDIKANLPVQGGGKEYIYYSDKITWNEAVTFCKDIGGNLAKIDSEDFQQRLFDAFESQYGKNVFPDDYWTGAFQPTKINFRWASDCSEVYYSSNLDSDWADGKMCFKFDKVTHWGRRCPCSETHPFICEKNLPSEYNCSIREIFAVNSLGTVVLNQSDCESACNHDPQCWMIIFTPPYGCVKLAYNQATLVQEVQASNSPVTVQGKFCFEVTKDDSSVTPSVRDSSIHPAVDCSVPGVIPAPVPFNASSGVTTPPPCSTLVMTVTPTPTTQATEIVTTTLLPSCTIRTLTESIYMSPSCETETVTIQTTPTSIDEVVTYSCDVETLTVTTAESQTPCIDSSCVCSSTSDQVCPPCSLEEVSSSLSPSNSTALLPASVAIIKALQIAEEISQNLTVDMKSTSAYHRRLTSIRDYRPSSTVMGYVGMCFVFIPLILIVMLDLRKIFFNFSAQTHYQNRSGMVCVSVKNPVIR